MLLEQGGSSSRAAGHILLRQHARFALEKSISNVLGLAPLGSFGLHSISSSNPPQGLLSGAFKFSKAGFSFLLAFPK